ALHPNGTLRWRFQTNDYIKGPASIADDGTIYFTSYDRYLYALHSNNGSMKWKVNVGQWPESNPSIASDGTIYIAGDMLYAINPDGTMKWSFDMGQGRWIHKSSPAISADGTIYIGTHIGDLGGGEIIAVNPDGTERWRKQIADALVDSSPCIGEDGTVYIGSNSDDYSFLHAFNTVGSNNPPDKPVITGPTTGGTGKEYNFTFSATDPDEDNIYYFIEWGDDTTSGWLGWYNSGEEITVSHTWSEPGTYNIKAKVKDYLDVESDWSTFKVSMPKHRMTNSFLIKFKEDYFHIFQLVKHYCSR
ncbi:MAG: PQQ-binding-like beta-propeller repeat protein, partial [Thermoplasmatales archaeon]